MGTIRLKIVRRVYEQSIANYSKYNLYLAEETDPAPFNAYRNNVFFLSTDDYKPGQHVHLDDDRQDIFKNNKSGLHNGNKVIVERAKPLVLTGHMKVTQSIAGNAPVMHFRNVSVNCSENVLYETDHIQDDQTLGPLSRVFSAVSPGYWRGESIPATEVTELFPLGAPDGYRYFLHDMAKYKKRLVEAMPKF